MAFSQELNTFLQQWKRNTNFDEDSNPQETHSGETGSSIQSRILDIERAERAERAALIERTERLCVSQKAHSDAVLERMGFPTQQDILPSLQPPPSPKKRPVSSLRERRIKTALEEDNTGWRSRTNQTFEEEDPFFERKLLLGSQMAVCACKLAKLTAESRSPSPDSIVSSEDASTPTELRDIPLTGRFTPTPPPAAIRRPSRLPVMSVKYSGADKEVEDGCKLQSATSKVEELFETLEKFQLIHCPSPPAAPRKTPVVAPKGPAPPPRPAPPNKGGRQHRTLKKTPMVPQNPPQPAQPNKRRPHRDTMEESPKVPAPPPKAAPAKRNGPRRGTKLCPQKTIKDQEVLKPLANPSESLSLCFTQLDSDDWEKKLDGLRSVRALAQHHPDILHLKLHEVCLVLAEEVSNLRSAVACAAMDTVAMLHIHLGRTMDPEAERTGRALLLKFAQTTNAFIHQQANLALDALVEGCSPGRIISALLNAGLNHRCVAVRASTAQHLHQLADIIGEDQIFTAGKTFSERFLIAVGKMAVDGAPEVRHHGQQMLQGLAHQKEFLVLWDKVIPAADRHPLQKILQKMRK